MDVTAGTETLDVACVSPLLPELSTMLPGVKLIERESSLSEAELCIAHWKTVEDT